MFQKPQRPYYIYTDDQVPGDSSSAAPERDMMSSNRIRRLIRDLTRRQDEVKAAHETRSKKAATTR
ncbi:MAG: hypothetical protein KC496_02730 [Anaerolineae bacterium]|nr:hypothetical protein [Anaerolineae bacterium]